MPGDHVVELGDQETCSVCGTVVPKPVELHHSEEECRVAQEAQRNAVRSSAEISDALRADLGTGAARSRLCDAAESDARRAALADAEVRRPASPETVVEAADRWCRRAMQDTRRAADEGGASLSGEAARLRNAFKDELTSALENAATEEAAKFLPAVAAATDAQAAHVRLDELGVERFDPPVTEPSVGWRRSFTIAERVTLLLRTPPDGARPMQAMLDAAGQWVRAAVDVTMRALEDDAAAMAGLAECERTFRRRVTELVMVLAQSGGDITGDEPAQTPPTERAVGRAGQVERLLHKLLAEPVRQGAHVRVRADADVNRGEVDVVFHVHPVDLFQQGDRYSMERGTLVTPFALVPVVSRPEPAAIDAPADADVIAYRTRAGLCPRCGHSPREHEVTAVGALDGLFPCAACPCPDFSLRYVPARRTTGGFEAIMRSDYDATEESPEDAARRFAGRVVELEAALAATPLVRAARQLEHALGHNAFEPGHVIAAAGVLIADRRTRGSESIGSSDGWS